MFLLKAGDYRQLPSILKVVWDEVRRRDLRATPAYLSTLDPLRLLLGTDVIEDVPLKWFECGCDREAVDPPLVQLETTYRFDDRVASLMERTVYSKDGSPTNLTWTLRPTSPKRSRRKPSPRYSMAR